MKGDGERIPSRSRTSEPQLVTVYPADLTLTVKVDVRQVMTPSTENSFPFFQYVYAYTWPLLLLLEDSLYVYVLHVDVLKVDMVTPELDNPTYTHGVHPKRVNPNRLSVYVPPASRTMVEEARVALERDGSSLSAFMLEHLAKWWEKHKPGNPQVDLERYGIDPAAGPGPGIPKSVCYHDRLGAPHWCWFRQLPRDAVVVVQDNGEQQFMSLSRFLSKD